MEDSAAVDVDAGVAAAVVLDDSVGVVGEAELPELVDGGVAVEVTNCGVAVRATAEEAVVLVAMAVGGDDEQAPKLTPASAASPAVIREPRNLEYRFMNRLLLNPQGLSTGPCTATIPTEHEAAHRQHKHILVALRATARFRRIHQSPDDDRIRAGPALPEPARGARRALAVEDGMLA